MKYLVANSISQSGTGMTLANPNIAYVIEPIIRTMAATLTTFPNTFLNTIASINKIIAIKINIYFNSIKAPL